MIIGNDLKMIDVNMALDLMNGIEQVYFKVVQTFLEEQKNLIEEIEASLACNYDEARRLVHTCKGISRSIGSNPLYEVSANLEDAIIKQNKTLISDYFAKFKEIFKQVVKDLNNLTFKLGH